MAEPRLPGLQGQGSELARLMLAQLFLNACVTGARMAAPLQALRLGHGEAEVDLLIALFALAQVFLALPTGRYCDRHGLKRPMVGSVLGASDRVPPAPAVASRAGGAWDLWRDPGLRRLLIVTWLLSSCWDVHTFLVPVLGHERGFPASTIGSILGAFGIAAAAVRLLTPLVAAQLREWAILVGAHGSYRHPLRHLSADASAAGHGRVLGPPGLHARQRAANGDEPAAPVAPRAATWRRGGHARDRDQRVQRRHPPGVGRGRSPHRRVRRVLGGGADGGRAPSSRSV